MGYLTHMKIWNVNSVEDENASWFLKYIIVCDLQTKQKFYSICGKWFHGNIERNLIFIPEIKFKRIMMKHEGLKEKFSDLHLWYSVFTRPIGSLFNRLNRVTCCFLSLYVSMLLITIYYANDEISSDNNSSIFFNLTQEQVCFKFILN